MMCNENTRHTPSGYFAVITKVLANGDNHAYVMDRKCQVTAVNPPPAGRIVSDEAGYVWDSSTKGSWISPYSPLSGCLRSPKSSLRTNRGKRYIF